MKSLPSERSDESPSTVSISTTSINGLRLWRAESNNISVQGGAKFPGRIGAYRLIRLVGEGGMGSVYAAEQEHPRRIVALKIIKTGTRNSETVRRFEREAQALGRLQHPGIAQIYQAGTADTGFGPQPYLAMEFISGQSLVQYAEGNRLNTRQRLQIMTKICDAVHHAHQRGLIHRDLKPSNILVDATGQPKILDFGVARVSDSEPQAANQTSAGQLIGTLAYMSPEQVLGNPLELDARSDVYALGVILYELLARRLPYTLGHGLHEVVQTIRERDPVPLSSISSDYRGDIEIIAAKALEKDKARRYVSAAGLGSDIASYLADEPISARPPSAVYQLQKFARRRRTLVTSLASVFLVLVAGIVASIREENRARNAEEAALHERDRAIAAEQQIEKKSIELLELQIHGKEERGLLDEALSVDLPSTRDISVMESVRDAMAHALMSDYLSKSFPPLSRAPASRFDIWPVEGRIIRGFAQFTDPFSGGSLFHRGVDIAVKSGATVRATGDGVVVFSSSRDDVSLVVIDHGTILTYYAYLSNLVVRTGQEVRRGDQIGEATAPHLHYEMRISSEEQNTKRSAIPLNPYRYLANASTFQLAHMPDSQK